MIGAGGFELARPRRKSTKPQLTPGQASYVLDRLIRDRRVTKSEVSRYMSEMESEIGFLEKRLQALKEAAGNVVRMISKGRRRGRPAAAAAAATPGRRRRRRGSAVTAEQKASRQLQGRYLGLIRQIPASRRAQYQRIAKEKGREAAVKEMASALGK
ncbi:MAG TPA: hypothetical protein VMS98_19520 [Thermoanaerobaculia bacterium]|nr:hypothetical protein [Thermoanaerobaculia bacterium]